MSRLIERPMFTSTEAPGPHFGKTPRAYLTVEQERLKIERAEAKRTRRAARRQA